MSLVVFNEEGYEVNETNPILAEHIGETGGAIELGFTLTNTSSGYYYENIELSVNQLPGITADIMIIGERVPNYRRKKNIRQLNPHEEKPFNIRIAIDPETPEDVVRGMGLRIKSKKIEILPFTKLTN